MLNTHFNTPDNYSEKEFISYEEILIEVIQLSGENFAYLPRNSIDTDLIIGEDLTTTFDSAIVIEGKVVNKQEFDGEGAIFMPFGIINKDEITLHISKRRFEEEVKSKTRPQAGDLLYSATLFTSLFEIVSVKDNIRFSQFQNRALYTIKASKFINSNEDISTGFTNIDDTLETHEISEVASDKPELDNQISSDDYFNNLFKNK